MLMCVPIEQYILVMLHTVVFSRLRCTLCVPIEQLFKFTKPVAIRNYTIRKLRLLYKNN